MRERPVTESAAADPAEAVEARSIAAAPRARLVAAMADAIESGGYRETTVADVVRIARTSRRTFYEHFSGREACFLALFEERTQQMLERIAAAVRPELSLADQVDGAIDAYIGTVTERPLLHQSFVRELPGLGPEGAERQRRVSERFAALLVGLTEQVRAQRPEAGLRPLPTDVAIIVVGGLRELLVIAIQSGRDPRELREQSSFVVRAILRELVAD